MFIFLEKISESLREAPGGTRRPPKGLSRIFCAWNPALEKFEKVHQRVLRTTRRWRSIDRPKSSLHQGLKWILNWLHEMAEARKEESCFLTKSQRNFQSFSPRPWQKTIWCWTFMKNYEKTHKILISLQKVPGNLGEAPEASEGLRKVSGLCYAHGMRRWKTWKRLPKSASHNTSMALHRPPQI